MGVTTQPGELMSIELLAGSAEDELGSVLVVNRERKYNKTVAGI